MPTSDDQPGRLYEFFLHGPHKPIAKWHHYFPIYEAHFRRLRERMITLVEIGVFEGGSLQMWKSYFTSGSTFFGVDIDPECRKHAEPGITILIGDAGNKEFLREILQRTGLPDIVVDDGGHTATQQITAFEILYPSVRDGGIYLVEDTHTSLWPSYVDTPDGRTFLQLAHAMTLELHGWTGDRANFERLNVEPRERGADLEVSEFCRTTSSIHFYDSVVVFEKKGRTEPWHQTIGAPT